VTPRVSVVIAARDAAATLPDTLASVHAQTVGGWEVVVVDDGSRDGTAELALAAGPNVRVLRNREARGPAAARNRGVAEARGELIATLDADDAWLPRYLESQLATYDRAMSEGRRVGAVCCDADLVRDDGPTGARWTDRVGRVQRIDITVLLRENVVFTSVVMPRSVFLDLGGYAEDPRLGVEDYDLWLRMVERGYEIVMNPEVLAAYRLGGDALSANIERMAEGAQLMLTRALGRAALSARERRAARRRRRAYGAVAWRARIAAEPDRVRRWLRVARGAPLIALSALEQPQRWRHWLREGPRSAGARRHTG
jgi:glycosyltransferase involved in cell wall biosynthesis